jgi:hypothetical protein
LFGSVVRIPSRRVVGGIEDATNFGDRLSNRRFDPMLEGDGGHATTLTPPTHLNEDIVSTNIDELHETAVRGDCRVDFLTEDNFDPSPQLV